MTPPTTPTTFSLTKLAIFRPPSTAAPVQSACPKMPPRVTPTTSMLAASPIVAICASWTQRAAQSGILHTAALR